VWMMSRINRSGDQFPPDVSLLKLPIVQTTFKLLVLVALFMVITVIWTSWPMYMDLSSNGYEETATLFKAPIAIILLLIPVLALIASNHRSVQTVHQISLTTKQIELANGQNVFANYYKHVEEFSKWCDHIKGIGEVKSKRKLHKAMFPNARRGDFSVSDEFIKLFSEHIHRFCSASEDFAKEGQGVSPIFHLSRMTKFYAIKFWLSAPPISEDHVPYPTTHGPVLLPNRSFKGFMEEQLAFIRAVDELLSFDPDYEASDYVKSLLSVPTNMLPVSPGDVKPFELLKLREEG
jgi:hypothetical protein